MLFGDLIAHLRRGAGAAEVYEAVGDIVLFRQVEQTAERFGETAGEYVAGAAARYAAMAEGEEWMGLVQTLHRDTEAATTALQRILRWALARDGLDHDG